LEGNPLYGVVSFDKMEDVLIIVIVIVGMCTLIALLVIIGRGPSQPPW
jgi:hypothetical protein